MRIRWAVGVVLVFLPVHAAAQPPARPCAALASLALASTTLTLAAEVAPGPFTVAPEAGGAFTIPVRFCRVAATLAPSADSDIKVEVWLPLEGWNGKFLAAGNGAFTGAIVYPAMVEALRRGYATASTDTGHVGNTAAFGLGHPEKVIDFGWRAVHEMTVTAKQVIAAFYGAAPRYSYWNSCSAGGRQGMQEAQRFPADFNGIIAGAPGLDWTGRAAQAVRVAQVLEQEPAARLSAAQTALLHTAALAACDARDGVADSLIGQPDRCTFDPRVLECRAGSSASSCLTPAQVNTAALMYSPLKNPSTQREIPGLAPGSELAWTDLGWTASARNSGLEQFRYLVARDPQWTIERFTPDDVGRAEAADNNTLNAMSTTLRPFFDRGGKLIQYHGWSDAQISPYSSVQYYQRVEQALGGAALRTSHRLFMAPGMGHCGGGEGPSTFDAVSALERWVEQGQAPDRLVASRTRDGRVDRTRPLCPYPQVARYTGTGSTDAAENFVCANP